MLKVFECKVNAGCVGIGYGQLLEHRKNRADGVVRADEFNKHSDELVAKACVFVVALEKVNNEVMENFFHIAAGDLDVAESAFGKETNNNGDNAGDKSIEFFGKLFKL